MQIEAVWLQVSLNLLMILFFFGCFGMSIDGRGPMDLMDGREADQCAFDNYVKWRTLAPFRASFLFAYCFHFPQLATITPK